MHFKNIIYLLLNLLPTKPVYLVHELDKNYSFSHLSYLQTIVISIVLGSILLSKMN